MQKPIIAIFVPTMLIGGAEKSLLKLANGLASRGWTIQLLLMSKVGPLLEEVASEVEVVDLGCSSFREAVLVLSRYYRDRRPEVILTSLYATGLAAIAARMLSGHKPKVIVGAHNSLRAKAAHPDNMKDRFLLMPLCRLLFPKADGFIAVSTGLAEELEQLLGLPGDRICTIYNPVVTPELTAMAEEAISHPWLDQPRQGQFKTLVSVGRLVEQKGFDVLLKALSIARETMECRLILVGGGPLQAQLQAQAERLGLQNVVDMVGWEENPFKFVARADLFVLSSRWEGLANVVIEALACGCPVVATNCDYGPEEILGGGKYGELAEVDNPEHLASKILKALRADERNVASDATRRSRSLDFTVEASVQHYAQYFSSLCSASA